MTRVKEALSWTLADYEQVKAAFDSGESYNAITRRFNYPAVSTPARIKRHGDAGKLFRFDGRGNRRCRTGHYAPLDAFDQLQDSCRDCLAPLHPLPVYYCRVLTQLEFDSVVMLVQDGMTIAQAAAASGVPVNKLYTVEQQAHAAEVVCVRDGYGNQWCEDCGGYVPPDHGGIDAAVCTYHAKERNRRKARDLERRKRGTHPSNYRV